MNKKNQKYILFFKILKVLRIDVIIYRNKANTNL